MDRAVRDRGVGSWIERRADLTPDHPALVVDDRPIPYADLAVRIRRLATGLAGLGVGRGDRVAWLGPNHAAFLELLFATGRLGAVLAPVNHRLDPDVRAAVLRDTSPVVLVEHAMAETTVAPSVRHRVAVGGVSGAGALAYEDLLASAPGRGIAATDAIDATDPVGTMTGPDDLCLLPHTSGTTGIPKAVMLTHRNITWNAIHFSLVAGLGANDVTIAIAPFFRAGGTGVNVLPTLFAGGTVVVPTDPSPDAILRTMERHRITIGFANPDLLEALRRTDAWTVVDLSAVRSIVTGGAPVPERLIRAYLERGLTLLQGYGLSEAAPFVLLLDAARALAKVGAAGRPPMFIDVRVTDDDGVDLPPGATGELRVRGPNVMAGYWHRPAETARTVVDGWLRTGDAARRDEDGDIWIVDRIEARYRTTAGFVFPGDVERVLLEHPSVADAGVVGLAVPGAEETGLHVGAAFVVLVPGLEVESADLLAHCRTRLAAHQVPASVTLVATLPRNAVGKLVRADLARRTDSGPPSTTAGGTMS